MAAAMWACAATGMGKSGCVEFCFFLLLYFGLCWVSPVVQAFSSCGEQGYSLVALHRLLTAVVSLVVELGL